MTQPQIIVYSATDVDLIPMLDQANVFQETNTFNKGVIVFSSLTNNQKLALVDSHIKDVIVNLANTFKSQKVQDTARATEEANKYSL